MSESDLTYHERPAATSVLLILLTTVGGFYFIGPLIGIVFAIPLTDGSVMDMLTNIAGGRFETRYNTPLYVIQGCATFIGLVVGPSLYAFSFERERTSGFAVRPVSALILFVTAVIVLAFMGPNSLVMEWNMHVTFPEFLKGFGDWARLREDDAQRLTDFLTNFESTSQFLLGLLVIAVLPAMGEEFVFRGLLQPRLTRMTGNTHAAIWISAFLFSLMHMQFFGFIPRLFLGALFGYLYNWSGNLLVPVTAHFVHNGFTLLILYLHQLGKVDIDVDTPEAMPWPMVILGTIVTFVLLIYLRRLVYRNTETRAE